MTPKQIRALRKKLGMTQKEMAIAIGLNQDHGHKTISYFENGRQTPTKAQEIIFSFLK